MRLANSPAEGVRVGALKREIESLNPQVRVGLGEQQVSGFPSFVDGSRFEREFGFKLRPVEERLRRGAE